MQDAEIEDFRLSPMESAEGRGIARRAWEAYVAGVDKVTRPVIEPHAKNLGASMTVDLLGFWLAWHLEGGFEGLQRMGMSRSAIYRRIKMFRQLYKVHPDEWVYAGVTIDLDAYWAAYPAAGARAAERESRIADSR
jgi:hypothetical protein